ncbi:membrane protein YfhO [Rudaeicoccus suwonensis]|uniref:Membrane protein YfhO n=1 Tax=Rudaeicoccus suwonensis TaxID=657409 RepID=A0A561DVB4_9MICO|nr:membrane protein YfhO [Rudaeicoccus suwonensis]
MVCGVNAQSGGHDSPFARLIRSHSFRSFACVTVVVLLANAVFLLGIRSNDALLYFSGLGSPGKGFSAGAHTLDGNQGWTAQALGHYAAQTWLHGHVPLWTNFEGLGQPLAGEMQSAAFFLPFVLVQALPNGLFLMQVLLELVAGFGTLMFLRSLRLSWVAATTGACLFAVNGTFSVMQNAPFAPLAFLPVALWGVELIAEGARDGRRSRAGLWVTAWAVAFMIFAGFPETAYMEGLFILGWAVLRFVGLRSGRRRFTALLCGGGVLGLLIAAPVLVAFKAFLDFADVAYHVGATNDFSYSFRKVTAFALPYGVGPMNNAVFGGMAGYLTLPAVLVGLVGFLGRRRRGLQLVLGVIVAALVLNMFGVHPVKAVFNITPGLRETLVAKYGIGIIEFAVVICVAFGIDDLRRARVRRAAAIAAVVVVAGYLLASVVYADRRGFLTDPTWTATVVAWTALACGGLAAVLFALRHQPRRARLLATIAAVIVILDGAGTYAIPQLSASPSSPVNTGPVRYLQDNLGTARFITAGPIQPNYGTYYGLAQLNVNDLPVPSKMSDLIAELAPRPGTAAARATSHSFRSYWFGPYGGLVNQRGMLTAYVQKQSSYRSASVKYVVLRRDRASEAILTRAGLSRVYQDATVEIWQDPKAGPVFSTASSACTVTPRTFNVVALDCPEATTLTRRTIATPGWSVTIDGSRHTVAVPPAGYYQRVAVPAGRYDVTFAYQPRFFVAATVVSFAVGALMVADLLVPLVRCRHSRDRRPVASA